MTTAIAERPATPMPQDQIDLIRRTVANGATHDELALFLYDCQRRGIHPLDKLLHFTKRGGRYTPVTSIDFMRSQAAMSGEMAGSDDPVFFEGEAHPISATVTVYRITQGQRFAYAATARWDEYCPDNAPMWKRMPHTMLGKCAEALALRKAFPQQLAGLYSADEMDQADSPRGFVVESPALAARTEVAAASQSDHAIPSEPNGGASATLDLPPGAVLITKVESGSGKTKGFLHHSGQTVSLHGLDGLALFDDRLVTQASEACQQRTPVMLEIVVSNVSKKPYVKRITAVKPAPSDVELDAEIARREMARQAELL